jgi:hypothetical protein
MTLPDERYRAVRMAREFLYDLCDPKKTPGVPKRIREQAVCVLRHYPSDYHMDRASEGAPDVFQPKMEALTRLMAVYEEGKKDNAGQ